MHRTKRRPGRVRTGSKAGNGAVKICRHFLLGQCTYGSRCRYSHDDSDATSPSRHVPRKCKGKGKGKGTGTGKGQGPGQVKRASRQRRHLGNATPPRSKAGTAGKGAPVKARVRNNNNAFPNASVCGKANNGARTCLHYRRGWCAYGEACRFTHPQEKEDAAAAVAAFAAAKAADDGSGLQLVLRLPSELWMEVLCFHSLLELVTTTICKVRGARGERGGGGAVCGVWHWLCVYWCSQGSPGQLGEQFHYQWTVIAILRHRNSYPPPRLSKQQAIAHN